MDWFDPQFCWDVVSHVFLAAIASGFLAFFVRAVNNIKKNVNEFKEKQDIECEATRNIIKTEITSIHDKAIDDGFISKYKLECTERLYDSYRKLKGNSFVADEMEDIRNLPTKVVK